MQVNIIQQQNIKNVIMSANISKLKILKTLKLLIEFVLNRLILIFQLKLNEHRNKTKNNKLSHNKRKQMI